MSSLCLAQQRQAQLSWWQRTRPQASRFYSIRADLPRKQLRELADHLDTMYVEYSRGLSALKPRAPQSLNVFIFKTRPDYLETLRTRFGVDATGTGGVFFRTELGHGLAFFIGGRSRRRINHVIQHEGFHQFAFTMFGNDLPVWANEGLAEFFGEAAVVGRKVVIGQTNRRVLESVKKAIEDEAFISFEKMLTMTPAQWSGHVSSGQASLQYQQAWSMVHFLIYGDDGRYVNAFDNYLKLINAGHTGEQAFVKAFGTGNLQAFEKRWKKFMLDARSSSFVTALERIEFLAEGMLELARQDKVPTTIEQLREQLQEIDFVYTLRRHEMEILLKASDDDLFEIPMDDLAKKQPMLILSERKQRLSRREEFLQKKHPRPAGLRTENLRPNELAVKWVRDEDTHKVGYEIQLGR